MVATLVKMRLLSTKNYAYKSKSYMFSLGILTLYTVGILVSLYSGVILGILLNPERLLVQEGIVVALALLALLVVVMRSLFVPANSYLDPRSFKLFFKSSDKLARQMLIAQKVNMVDIAILLVMLSPLPAWLFVQPLVALLYVLPVLALFYIFACIDKILTYIGEGSDKNSDKKSKKQIFAVVIVILFYFIFFGSDFNIDFNLLQLQTAVSIATYIPVVSTAILPFSIVQMNYFVIVLQLAMTLACLIIFDRLYCKIFRKYMDTNISDTHSAKTKDLTDSRFLTVMSFAQKLGLSQVRSALFARFFIYWRTDMRYFSGVIVFPIISIFLVIFVVTGNLPQEIFFHLLVVFTMMLPFCYAEDIAYDSTAFTTQILCGVKGKDDRVVRPIIYVILAVLCSVPSAIGVEIFYMQLPLIQVAVHIIYLLLAIVIATAIAGLLGTYLIYPIQVPNSSIAGQKGVSNLGIIMLYQFVQMIAITVINAFNFVMLMLIEYYADSQLNVITISCTVAMIVYTVVVATVVLKLSMSKYDQNAVKLITTISSWPDHKIHIA